jgi:Arm domain-containing DNA-binding protein
MAQMAKITKRTVDALKPGDKSFIAFDDDVKGFGLRVMPSGVKSYVLEYRPGSGGRGMAKRRLTLGKHGAMTAEQARKAAQEALARIRLGGQGPASRQKPSAGFSNGWRAHQCFYRRACSLEVQTGDGVWL